MNKDNYPKAYLYRRIVQSKMFIDKHFSEPINIEDIADEAHFSKFHFIRLFKKVYGKTPHQYLIKVRLENAAQLLKAGTTVSETCLSVGFEGLSSFSTLFKSYYKISPIIYSLQQAQLRDLRLTTPLHFIPGCHVQGIKCVSFLDPI